MRVFSDLPPQIYTRNEHSPDLSLHFYNIVRLMRERLKWKGSKSMQQNEKLRLFYSFFFYSLSKPGLYYPQCKRFCCFKLYSHQIRHFPIHLNGFSAFRLQCECRLEPPASIKDEERASDAWWAHFFLTPQPQMVFIFKLAVRSESPTGHLNTCKRFCFWETNFIWTQSYSKR